VKTIDLDPTTDAYWRGRGDERAAKGDGSPPCPAPCATCTKFAHDCIDTAERDGAGKERAAIVADLHRYADELAAEAQRVPLGRAHDGGPLHDAPIYDVIMRQVVALHAAAERVEHEGARREADG
jgi:hypothetical protein